MPDDDSIRLADHDAHARGRNIEISHRVMCQGTPMIGVKVTVPKTSKNALDSESISQWGRVKIGYKMEFPEFTAGWCAANSKSDTYNAVDLGPIRRT